VVIYRFSHDKSPMDGRSRCPKCNKLIRWYHNIPVLSYIVLRGRCADCKKNISIVYPLVELLTGVMFAWWFVIGSSFFRLLDSPWTLVQPIYWLFVGMMSIVVVVADYLYMIIPLPINLGLLSVTFIYRLALAMTSQMMWMDFYTSLLAGVVWAGVLWSIRWLVLKIKGVEAVGLADVILALSLGMILGWQQSLVAFLLSYLVGTVVLLPLLVLGIKKRTDMVPFGPFMVIGALLSLLWGSDIFAWYMSLML
jgi:prepilin signal peptidase PulO-like enzyme (type II secretory pathway)